MYHNHHLHETKHLKEANLLQEEKYRHLTNDPVGKLVCEMAVPTIISMLVTAVYNLADTFFVGLMRSNAATGAVGVVFSLMAIIQATGFFFGQGSGNYISRQLGRHQTEDAEAMAITAVTLAFSAGVVLLISFWSRWRCCWALQRPSCPTPATICGSFCWARRI